MLIISAEVRRGVVGGVRWSGEYPGKQSISTPRDNNLSAVVLHILKL